MSNLLFDLKYAFRMLLKTPGFTVVAVLTLALGIGANTAIFSVIESVLLHRLPYHDPDRLIMLWGDSNTSGNHRGQVSFTDVEDWRRSTAAFEDIATIARWNAVMNGEVSQRVPAIQVSDAFFRVMDVRPMLGRLFLPEDQVDGKDFVIVISNELWRERFHSDPQVVGSTVRINSAAYTIIGVLPPSFAPLPRTIVDGKTAIYRPCAEVYDLTTRDNRHFRAIGRLKPHVTLAQAQAQLTAVASQLAAAYPEDNARYGIRAITLQADTVGGVRPAILLLLGGVVFVLMIACANLANLLLARFTRREREMAIRSALGASRGRLLRQLLTESLMLAAAGGSLGLLLTTWIVAAVDRALGSTIPAIQHIEVSPAVLLFTVAASAISGVVFGLLPALHGTRADTASLKTSGMGSIGIPHHRLRDGLVIAEMALAVVLLTCAGLFLRTIQQLRSVDPGFGVDNVVTSDFTLPYVKYGKPENGIRFVHDLLARVQTIPGIESAGVVSTLPMTDFDTVGFFPEGMTIKDREPEADRYVVTPGYLSAMGITLKSGRLLSDHDSAKAPLAVLVSETLAREIWPGQDAVGKRIQLPTRDDVRPWRTVVGVVGDVKQYSLDSPFTRQLYLPYDQFGGNNFTMAVHSGRLPSELIAQVRKQVGALDSDVAVADPELLTQILADSIQTRRLTMFMLVAFAGLAIVLASIGIYGVLSYVVSSRTREIGLRMALGATHRRILAMILRQGLRLSLAGVAVGVVLALVAARAIRSMLFAVEPYDLLTLTAITLLLLAVATIATYLPARRASAVDPMEALRQD
jgi:predicted permease